MSDELRREVDEFGTVRYYNKGGKYHRLDGPAIEYADEDKEWWIEGKRHRLDGPAVEYSNGARDWWIEGKYYTTEKEWEKARCPSIEEVAAMFKEVGCE